MTATVEEIIEERTRSRATPAQILDGLEHGGNPFNPTFLAKDIYNAKAAIRRKALGNLTPIQALIDYLYVGDWWVKHLKDREDRVTHLFFSKTSCHTILK